MAILKPLQVLVADDDVDAAEMYRVTLEARGHTVTVALDGQQCLNSYTAAFGKSENARKGTQLPFDAVILDYKMPIMNGLEVAKEILKTNPSQRIIFASGFVKETLMESVRELNQVMELIQKPFEPEVLVDLVEDISTLSSMNDLNSLAAGMMKKNDQAADDSQIDKLLRLMKKIQKPGTI